MRQTKLQSLAETVVSTAIGFVVSLAATSVVMPAFGFHTSSHQNLSITAIFTVISILRGMAIRRLFNWWHHRMPAGETP